MAGDATIIVRVFNPKMSARIVISSEPVVVEKPKTKLIPNQRRTMAVCAVAASPKNLLLPTSSKFAKPAAMSTAKEIRKPIKGGLKPS